VLRSGSIRVSPGRPQVAVQSEWTPTSVASHDPHGTRIVAVTAPDAGSSRLIVFVGGSESHTPPAPAASQSPGALTAVAPAALMSVTGTAIGAEMADWPPSAATEPATARARTMRRGCHWVTCGGSSRTSRSRAIRPKSHLPSRDIPAHWAPQRPLPQACLSL